MILARGKKLVKNPTVLTFDDQVSYSDDIGTFSDFERDYKIKLSQDMGEEFEIWGVHSTPTFLNFYLLSCDEDVGMRVVKSILMKQNLRGNVGIEGRIVVTTYAKQKFQKWSDVIELLRFVGMAEDCEISLEQAVSESVHLLSSVTCVPPELEMASKARPIVVDLLKNMIIRDPRGYRYSADTKLASSLWRNISSACYGALRSILPLPSSRNLDSLTKGFDTLNTNSYLDEMCKDLIPMHRYVSLQFDEIYMKPSINYKNGLLHGYAYDGSQGEVAKTCQGFLVGFSFPHLFCFLMFHSLLRSNLFSDRLKNWLTSYQQTCALPNS